MSKISDLSDCEPPATPTEERLALFLANALSLLEHGQPIDVSAMLADQPELIEHGCEIVADFDAFRKAAFSRC